MMSMKRLWEFWWNSFLSGYLSNTVLTNSYFPVLLLIYLFFQSLHLIEFFLLSFIPYLLSLIFGLVLAVCSFWIIYLNRSITSNANLSAWWVMESSQSLYIYMCLIKLDPGYHLGPQVRNLTFLSYVLTILGWHWCSSVPFFLSKSEAFTTS